MIITRMIIPAEIITAITIMIRDMTIIRIGTTEVTTETAAT